MSTIGRACIVIIGLSLPMWAQQQSPSEPMTGAPAASPFPAAAGHQIRLDVIVTDKAGHPVPGLEKQNFTVRDNKQPQQISSFQGLQADTTGAQPATQAVLVIDTANASFQAVSYEQQQLDKLFKQNGGMLAVPISLVIFSDSGVQMQNAPTRDGGALAKMLDQTEHSLRVINRSQGFYGATDRLQLSLNALGQITAAENRKPGRKLLIWIGPGWPILSGPGIQLTNKQAQAIFESVASITNALRQARVTLYNAMALGVGGNLNRLLYYEAFLKPISKESQAQNGNLAVQVLAIQSGGRVLNSTSDLAAQVTSCMADADAFYTLSFNPQAADKRTEFHELKVTVDKPGVDVRTNAGYYALP